MTKDANLAKFAKSPPQADEEPDAASTAKPDAVALSADARSPKPLAPKEPANDRARSPVLLDDDEDGFLRRRGGAIASVLAIVGVVGGLAAFLLTRDGTPPPKRIPEPIVVTIQPPPPPPPPPPPDQPKPEPQMEEQPKMAEPEIKEDKPVEQPKEAPPEQPPDEPPPGPLGLDAAAEGPGDAFNLAGKPGGKGLGLGGGGGGGGGSKWGWYASIVQQQVEAALRRHPRTRSAVAQLQIRVWADKSGRVTRIQPTSTGDAALDAAIRNEAFAGITLRQPPPSDMPMPIVMRVTARRPS